MQKIILLGLAGALGTLARYGMAGWVQRAAGGAFPWGTLTVNLCGCFLAGLFWALAENRLSISGEVRVVILIGFMGGFTTFSAFMLETGGLLRDGEWLRAMGNVLAHNVIGLGVFWSGLTLGRFI